MLCPLQALVMTSGQPGNLLWIFCHVLYGENSVKEDTFYSWESSKDPDEQQGKSTALQSVTVFFQRLHEKEGVYPQLRSGGEARNWRSMDTQMAQPATQTAGVGAAAAAVGAFSVICLS